MIKIIANRIGQQVFQPSIMMTFCTKKLKKKSSDITPMFSDAGVSLPKDKTMTSGTSFLR